MNSFRRLRGLGALTPYGINVDGTPVYIDDNGDVYDSSGNLMTNLVNVDSTTAGQQSASNITTQQVQQTLNMFSQALAPLGPYSPFSPPATAPVPQPSGWQKFTTWLGQPVAQGWPSAGAILGFAALGTVVVSMVGSSGNGRRRR